MHYRLNNKNGWYLFFSPAFCILSPSFKPLFQILGIRDSQKYAKGINSVWPTGPDNFFKKTKFCHPNKISWILAYFYTLLVTVSYLVLKCIHTNISRHEKRCKIPSCTILRWWNSIKSAVWDQWKNKKQAGAKLCHAQAQLG